MLKIVDDQVKHIRRVLRLRVGDGITVFDGSGKEYEGAIVKAGTSVVIRVHRTLSLSRESPLSITLAQSLLKGEKMDYLVQKATELGITEIVLFFRPVRSLFWRHRRKQVATTVGKDLAIEASKQCGEKCFPGWDPFETTPRFSIGVTGVTPNHPV